MCIYYIMLYINIYIYMHIICIHVCHDDFDDRVIILHISGDYLPRHGSLIIEITQNLSLLLVAGNWFAVSLATPLGTPIANLIWVGAFMSLWWPECRMQHSTCWMPLPSSLAYGGSVITLFGAWFACLHIITCFSFFKHSFFSILPRFYVMILYNTYNNDNLWCCM